MASKFKRYIAEFIGTFIFVFVATGVVVVNAQTQTLGLIGIALATGFTLAVVVYAIGHISGAHINPAVTIAFWLGNKFKKIDTVFYIIAQLLGAVLASILVLSIIGGDAFLGATLPRDGDFVSAFYLEILLTFFLMFVIAGTAIDKKSYNQFAGLAIGLTISLDILLGGPISGASMNPARSFGPALLSGNFSYHWIYWLGPILGAILGIFSYKIIKLK